MFEKDDVLAIGCDHGGFALKNQIIAHLEERNIRYKDFGTYDESSVDYPDIAVKVAEKVVAS